MGTTVWPSPDDYQNAVRHPSRSLKDQRLHSTQVEMTALGALKIPFARSGNFGAVYRFANQHQSYAVKVFSAAEPGRELRYRLIHEHLANRPSSPNLVTFDYQGQGILVQGRWYPTLTMDWVAGVPLDRYIGDTLARCGKLDNRALCHAWVELVLSLSHRNVAHGDLQHGNILVTPNQSLKLVDYDGMYVPAMRQAGLAACEMGLAAYQHPRRVPQYFDERLDNFPALVVLLSLASIDAARWRRYHTDDNCLIVREADLLRPEQSALFAELVASPDAPVRKLAVILRAVAQKGLDDIPAFTQLVADGTIKQLLGAAWRPTPGPQPPPRVKESLTPRQLKVLAMVVEGCSDEVIAQRMGVQLRTVRDGISKLMNQAGVTTRKEFLTWAAAQVPAPAEPKVPPPETVTPSERALLYLMLQGYTDSEIITSLSLAPAAFHQSMADLRLKAQATTREALTNWAIAQGIAPAKRVPPRPVDPPKPPVTPNPLNPPVTPTPAEPTFGSLVALELSLVALLAFSGYLSSSLASKHEGWSGLFGVVAFLTALLVLSLPGDIVKAYRRKVRK